MPNRTPFLWPWQPTQHNLTLWLGNLNFDTVLQRWREETIRGTALEASGSRKMFVSFCSYVSIPVFSFSEPGCPDILSVRWADRYPCYTFIFCSSKPKSVSVCNTKPWQIYISVFNYTLFSSLGLESLG